MTTATQTTKILVVDDDSTVRDAIVERFGRSGNYELDGAANAAEALQMLVWGNYSRIVTDLKMPPGMNGLELAVTVRNSYPNMQIFIHSGDGSAEKDFIKAKKRGTINGYGIKPYSISGLKKFIYQYN